VRIGGYRFGGLTLLCRNSAGEMHLASWHPRGCGTWHWYVGFTRRQKEIRRLFSFAGREWRRNQWHDYIRVPFGHIIIGRQDYHKTTPTPIREDG
jgi:hypothetical protein